MVNVDRRRLLVLSGAAVAGLAWPGIAHTGAQPTRTRFSATSDNGKKMLEIYAAAVTAMKAPEASRSAYSWTFQWYTHWVRSDSSKLVEIATIFGDMDSPARDLANLTWSTCQAHGGGMQQGNFLPWHRAYLYYFERIVRKVTGRDEFTLPYWDYTADGVLPEQFRLKDDPVWGALYVADRNPWVNDGESIEGLAVNLGDMRQPQYYPSASGLRDGFNVSLDGNLHGEIHVRVGATTNMGRVPFAAKDPIFWLHHCNIDRIWAGWNDVGYENPSDAEWLEATHLFVDENEQRAEITNEAVNTTEMLGYAYDVLPRVPSAASGRVFVAQAIEARIAGNEEAVVLGQKATTAELSVVSPTAASALNSEGLARLYVVLDGISADVPPGSSYDVFASVDGQAPANGVYIGSVNFFDAVEFDGATRPKRKVFDLSGAIEQSSMAPEDVDALTYHFVPSGQVDPSARPVIQRIEVVKGAPE